MYANTLKWCLLKRLPYQGYIWVTYFNIYGNVPISDEIVGEKDYASPKWVNLI